MDNSLTLKKKPRPMTIVKIVLDVIMAVVFILLMDAKVISMAFHEIAGLAIGGVFLIHKLLNWKWIKNVSRNLFGRQVTAETRIRYIVDVLLFIGVYMIIISGALMSEYVFPSSGGGEWYAIHTTLSYICIPLIGFHAGLHESGIRNAFRKMLKITRESGVRKWVLRGASMAFAIWGVVSAVGSGFFEKMFAAGADVPFSSESLASLTDATESTDTGSSTFGSAANTQSTTESSSAGSGVGGSVASSQNTAGSGGGSADSSTASAPDGTQTATVSLEKFMSGLTCTACHKHCPLLSPQCSRGVKQQQEAIAQYEAQYGSTTQTTPTVYTDNGSNYLKIGTAVYTLQESAGSTSIAAEPMPLSSGAGAQTTQTDTSTELKPGGGKGHGNGLGDASGKGEQSVANVLLTFMPIMWLSGVVGWAVALLTGRRKKQKGMLKKT